MTDRAIYGTGGDPLDDDLADKLAAERALRAPMTRDDVIRMAREAGMADVVGSWCQECGCNDEMLARFAGLVAAAEREKCIYQIRMHTPRDGYDSPNRKRMDRLIEAINALGASGESSNPTTNEGTI